MLSRKATSAKSASNNSKIRIHGAVRGILSALTPQGEPIVDFCGSPAPGGVVALSTVEASRHDIGKEAIVVFEDGDPARPLLIGLVRSPGVSSPSNALDVKMDGQTLTLTAEHEISIRCGESSITLTRAGKVLIKGNYLLSRSNGPNRIKGGSVLLN